MNKSNTILIFAYYSFLDPVFQSAVLPYFRKLNSKQEIRFVLLTFEKEMYKMKDVDFQKTQTELFEQDNIIWYRSTWRSGKYKLVKKAIDFVISMTLAIRLMRKYRIKGIFTEAFPGAIMSHHLSRLFNVPHIVHSFEPHTQYMVEGGTWKQNAWEAKLLRKYELKIAKGCSHILTGTEKMIERISSWNVNAELLRVPSCVDTNVFVYKEDERTRLRKKLNIENSEILVVYLGKFGGMYMEDEAFRFFKVLSSDVEVSFKILVLSHDDHEWICDKFKEHSIPTNKWKVFSSTRDEIPSYLSAADFGFVGVRQHPGKRFCSPIKNGEYWACGLPLITPKNISDDYLFAVENNIGIVLNDMSKTELIDATNKIKKWHFSENRKEVIKRCRDFALKDRSIHSFQNMYRKIFTEILSK